MTILNDDISKELINPTMPDKKIYIGTISADERDAIRELVERKKILRELFKTLLDTDKIEIDNFYERILSDLTETTARYNDWWIKTRLKYSWESRNDKMEVDFNTCEVFTE